jgi:formylglycine-generating enzyme required for sulfatase activity
MCSNQKNPISKQIITAFFIMLQQTTFCQHDEPAVVLINKLKKNNKELAKELKTVKKIEGKTFIYQAYEGNDSMSFYFAEKVTVPDLYLSAYEVSNKQYREFVEYVKDSIARTLLGYFLQTPNSQKFDF